VCTVVFCLQLPFQLGRACVLGLQQSTRNAAYLSVDLLNGFFHSATVINHEGELQDSIRQQLEESGFVANSSQLLLATSAPLTAPPCTDRAQPPVDASTHLCNMLLQAAVVRQVQPLPGAASTAAVQHCLLPVAPLGHHSCPWEGAQAVAVELLVVPVLNQQGTGQLAAVAAKEEAVCLGTYVLKCSRGLLKSSTNWIPEALRYGTVHPLCLAPYVATPAESSANGLSNAPRGPDPLQAATGALQRVQGICSMFVPYCDTGNAYFFADILTLGYNHGSKEQQLLYSLLCSMLKASRMTQHASSWLFGAGAAARFITLANLAMQLLRTQPNPDSGTTASSAGAAVAAAELHTLERLQKSSSSTASAEPCVAHGSAETQQTASWQGPEVALQSLGKSTVHKLPSLVMFGRCCLQWAQELQGESPTMRQRLEELQQLTTSHVTLSATAGTDSDREAQHDVQQPALR